MTPSDASPWQTLEPDGAPFVPARCAEDANTRNSRGRRELRVLRFEQVVETAANGRPASLLVDLAKR